MTTPILFVLEGYSSHAYPATLALTDTLANSCLDNPEITNRTDEQRQCDRSQARLPFIITYPLRRLSQTCF
jgi:hypothetical protein